MLVPWQGICQVSGLPLSGIVCVEPLPSEPLHDRSSTIII